MRKLLRITWCTCPKGTFGLGVFEDQFGEREIRGAIVEGKDMQKDTDYIDNYGGLISSSELIRLVSGQLPDLKKIIIQGGK